jgi:cysteinyl-tRNA synthetase
MSTKYLGKEFDIHGGGMDLQFPHHECEIAQSTVCNHQMPARYWLHNNMITINGKKMGKSYNNVIKLSELFAGTHPILEQAYAPSTVRFFILQSQYRSTLDFSNEALQASEKALRRLMDAYEWLMSFEQADNHSASDDQLNEKVLKLVTAFDEYMNDDINTAKVIANMFELVPIINSLKDKHISATALDSKTIVFMKKQLTAFIVDIFGLESSKANNNNNKLEGVLQLLINMRKEAKQRKDFVTSDKIRNELTALGIQLKDEKDGGMSYTIQ